MTLPIIAFDWSMKHIHYTYDGETVATCMTLTDLLALLTEPHRIICEATFESYDLVARQKFIKDCADADHELLTTPNRATSRYRFNHNINKTDESDARVIYALGTTPGYALKRPNIVEPEFKQKAAQAERKIQLDRARGLKEQMTEAAATILGPYRDLTDSQKITLGNGKTYRAPMLAAIYNASQFTDTRTDFERLTGLYAHGYPSQHRSDLHYWGRRLEIAQAETQGRDPQPWTEYRRNIRWAYHTIKAQGTQ